ncbi:hypothetical protein D3C86_1873780 [compost metagenome]
MFSVAAKKAGSFSRPHIAGMKLRLYMAKVVLRRESRAELFRPAILEVKRLKC